MYDDMRAAYAATDGRQKVDLDALIGDYPNAVGWIHLDDADIDYPIVQGSDNSYYLSHDATDAYSISGAVFLDYRNKSLANDLYALVYAHNMLDNSMFSLLTQYQDQSFYESGKGTFWVATPEATLYYQVFAVNVVDKTDDIFTVGFTGTDDFSAFVGSIKGRSLYDTGVEVSGTDQVITLSTCSDYNRLVISAKLVERVSE